MDGSSLSSTINSDLRRNQALKEIPSPSLGLNDVVNQADQIVRKRLEDIEPNILSSGKLIVNNLNYNLD